MRPINQAPKEETILRLWSEQAVETPLRNSQVEENKPAPNR
jgi:hypothetical protein